MHRKRSLNETNPVPAHKRICIRVPRHKKQSESHIHGPLDQTTRHNVQQQQRRPVPKAPQLSSQQRPVSSPQQLSHRSPLPTTNNQRPTPNKASRTISAPKQRTAQPPNTLHQSSSNVQSHAHSTNRNDNHHSNSSTTHSVQSSAQQPEEPQQQSQSLSLSHEQSECPPVPPLQRKSSRKKKPMAQKVKYLLTEMRRQIGNRSLCQVVVVDHKKLEWWYCSTCDMEDGTAELRKSVRVRTIVDHLRCQQHHKKLTGELKVADTERRKKEEAEKQQKLKAEQELMELNRTQSDIIMQQQAVSESHDHMECKQIFQLNDANEWHKQIKRALDRCNLNHNLTIDQLRAINYFHTIHESVVQMSSVKSIQKSLKREQKHGAVIPSHYLSPRDIQDAVSALAQAQRDMDMELIGKHKEVSVSEDGNKLHRMPARGYMVKVIDSYKMIEIFCALKDPSKGPELEWDQLNTIDTGVDTFNAMKKFVQSDLQKRCKDIASIATDWSGTNGGKENGASKIWKTANVFTQWNWDDEHKLSRVSAKLKDLKHYKLIHDLCTAIRELICNSTISMQKYKKFLHQLNQQLISFSKDIEIRFNSILCLLDRVIKDYLFVLGFCDKLCSQSTDCQRFWDRYRQYEVDQRVYEHAKKRRKDRAPRPTAAHASPAQHAASLLRPAATQPLSPPKKPAYPKEMNILNALRDPRFLLVMALLSDYIHLFDDHAKKTGGREWIKCMTENELVMIEQTLLRWKDQSEKEPISPVFSQNRWKYDGPGGPYVFKVNVSKLEAMITECNDDLNRVLTEALADYYKPDERKWMRAELELVDPKRLEGASGEILRLFGEVAMGRLLDFYGVNQTEKGIQFEALINRKNCMEEYNDWKIFAVRETENIQGLSQYGRIMALYRKFAINYEAQYPEWAKLYKLILLNWSSSMSLERLFSARKKYQPSTCSNYSYQGLSDRLVLHHNSAAPGTADSVVLYMKAMIKWWEMKQKRIYSAISPLVDYRMQK